MAWPSRHSPQTRKAALALLRTTSLSYAAIGRRTGVPRATVATWSIRAKVRRPPSGPELWPKTRREAAARLLARNGADPREVATLCGLHRRSARAAFAAAGLCPERIEAAPSVDALRTALRRHIGRQIAAFDAALDARPAALDSARVLRDLGGLKRLLAEIEEPKPRHGDADGEPVQDLAALRESLARRYERFVRARGIDSVLGGRAAGRTDGAAAGLVANEPSGPAAAAG